MPDKNEYQRMREGQPSKDPMVWLWRSVIQQALIDATTQLSPIAAKQVSARMDLKRSREWFTRPNRDFEEVCNLAGLESSRVRTKAIPLIEAAAKLDHLISNERQRGDRTEHHHLQG